MNNDNTCLDKSEIVLAYAMLHGKYPVLIELIECVRLQLAGTRWLLLHGRRVTAEDLMGTAFWRGVLTRWERAPVGSVIAHLVATGELPLVKAEKRSRWERNTYLLKD